jgi:peptide/nickel transport system ATP-binding protein
MLAFLLHRAANALLMMLGENAPPDRKEAMRRIRGRRIGAIFQDPLTSLNPLFTVGRQLVESIRTHLDVAPAEARHQAIRLLQEVGIPAAE